MGGSQFFTLASYLNYRIKAVGAHSIHSPFVYKLVTQIIKRASTFRIPEIEAARKRFKSNHEIIDVIDFKANSSLRKPISSVAKSSLSTAKFSAFMHLLTNELDIDTVLETGTSLGVNTLYLSRSSAKKIVTMEASSIISEIAKKEFASLDAGKIILESGDITKTFEPAIIRHEPDLIFLDADHRSSVLKRQIEQLMKLPKQVKCIVIHDIYWSKDMRDTWNELVSDSRFELSIDIFQAGLLFPHKDIEKQHFTLRF
ncbi:MAG: hypothetical protein ABJG78_04265 [Cyclobacteriaceae bacterium]